MDYKKLGLGLGLFSIALGLTEIAARDRLSRFLGVDNRKSRMVLSAFGGRELLAGAMLLRGPAVSTNAWSRVFGDAMDLGALGLAFSRSRKQRAVAGAIGFVVGATLLDIIAGVGLDRETARTFPRSERAGA